jgi:hypothetical protein
MQQIERDLVAQAHLRILLAATDASIASNLQQLQIVKARMSRTQDVDEQGARG